MEPSGTITYRDTVYCAVNNKGDIQWVCGSRYFRTTKYLVSAVNYHNQYNYDDPWRIAKFILVEVKDE